MRALAAVLALLSGPMPAGAMQGLPPDVLEARLNEAAADLKNRSFDEAEESYRELLQQTGDGRAFKGLIDVLFAQRRFGAASAMLEQVASQRPDDENVRFLLADSYLRSGRHAAAIALYQKMIEKRPDSAAIWMRLGEAQSHSAPDEAIASYRKSAALMPGSPLPLVQIAIIEETRNRPAEAVKLYEALLSKQPDNPGVLNNLAYTLLTASLDVVRGLELARRARAMLPDHRDIADTYALALARNGQSAKALEIYRQLLASQPDRVAYHYGVAVAHAEAGSAGEAAAAAKHAITLQPSKLEELLLRNLLQSLEKK